jgi:GDP-L-fucose synthase
MSFWKGKRILVTGGAGFTGSFLVERLAIEGARVRVADNLSNGSLENLESCRRDIEFLRSDLSEPDNCRLAVRGQEVVFHLAALVGGVEFNANHPGTMFTQNTLVNTNMLESARQHGVERYLCVSSACVYPRFCMVPTPETEGFKDEPEFTNRGYGWAKRAAELQAQFYADEYGMKIGIIRPYNTYGPRDHFDPDKSHVIPAVIKRIYNGENPLIVWGNGEQTRAFVYVTDVVEGMLRSLELYPRADALNIGVEEEVSIKDLVNLMVRLSGKKPEVVFDASKPAGQPRRNADISKAKKLIGYHTDVRLEEGLKNTIEWYLKKTCPSAPKEVEK